MKKVVIPVFLISLNILHKTNGYTNTFYVFDYKNNQLKEFSTEKISETLDIEEIEGIRGIFKN